MKKLRNLIALFAVFSMAAVFTGCGDDDDDDDNNQNQGPQFAPATTAAFQGNTYTVDLGGGQQGTLTFPSAGTYSFTANGQTETGNITGLTRNGEDYIATLTPANNTGTVRAGEMRVRFQQKTATTYAGQITYQGANGPQTFPFTATVNTGGSTSGQTTSGQTTSGQTTSGQTTSGQTTSGQTTSGQTTSGQTTSGQTTSGQTTSGQTTSGQTTSGQTTSGQTTSGGTGEIPNSLTGYRLQLQYGQFGELFTFTSDTAGTYEQGPDTFTYTWNRADTRVLATRRNAQGGVVANYDIDLTFNQGSTSQGNAVVVYQEPNGTPTTDPAQFSLTQ